MFLMLMNTTRCSFQAQHILSRSCGHIAAKKTYYDILELKQNCTKEEIRHAFTKLSKLYHPDTCRTGNTQQNCRKFQEIMDAYRVLSKKDSRNEYDMRILTRRNRNVDSSSPYGKPFRHNDYEYMRRYRPDEQYYNIHRNQWDPNGFGSREDYRMWNSNPLFNKKKLHSSLLGFFLFNVIAVYVIYMSTRAHRKFLNDFHHRNYHNNPHGSMFYGSIRNHEQRGNHENVPK